MLTSYFSHYPNLDRNHIGLFHSDVCETESAVSQRSYHPHTVRNFDQVNVFPNTLSVKKVVINYSRHKC